MDTIIENDSVFEQNFPNAFLAVGDVTNDGRPDLVITTCCDARAAVFQGSGESWDDGTLLAGPSITVAARPIVAPIRNDGQNWLVYTEHLGGNNGQWLRSHRYDGVNLVENQDIATRQDWPGHHAPAVGDLDQDGQLEIWYIELYGEEPQPSMHLLRSIWGAENNSFQVIEIKDGAGPADVKIRPQTGDFLGNGTESLVWISQIGTLEFVTYTPGAGVDNFTSRPIFETNEAILDFHAGEVDGRPGLDIGVITRDEEGSRIYLISGESFTATQAWETDEQLRIVRLGDTDGDGQAEIYAASNMGGIFGEGLEGWQQLAVYEGADWQDGATVRSENGEKEEIFFSASVEGKSILVIRMAQ